MTPRIDDEPVLRERKATTQRDHSRAREQDWDERKAGHDFITLPLPRPARKRVSRSGQFLHLPTHVPRRRPRHDCILVLRSP